MTSTVSRLHAEAGAHRRRAHAHAPPARLDLHRAVVAEHVTRADERHRRVRPHDFPGAGERRERRTAAAGQDEREEREREEQAHSGRARERRRGRNRRWQHRKGGRVQRDHPPTYPAVLTDSPITLFLLAINVLVGIHSLAIDPETVGRLAFRPVLVRQGEWWRFFTAGFAHVGFGHLLFNMITLFSFGPVIEQILGPLAYILVYIGSDLAANALTYWRHKDDPGYSAVGASGAISGVLFSFCLFYPFEKIYLMLAIPMWSIVFAVLYIGVSVYAAGQGKGRIAHEAHLGGALGGVALTIALYPRSLQIFLSQIGLG